MEEKLSFRCANCGETVEFQIPSNWRDAEVKDLDGRPKETEKFSIARAIQKCPKCHYVSFDISKNIIKDKNILSTPEYNEILENRSLPEVVNNYLAMGFAYEKQEEYHNSSRAYLCASWLLESIGKVKDSKSLLEKAAFCLLLYINSKPFKENPDLAAFLRAVDVLRQIEKFDNAKKMASFAIKKTKTAPEKNILEYELLLCSEQISQSKEIPEYIESPTSLKQIVAEFLNVDYGDNLRKLRVFNQMREYLKKCKIAEFKEGVNLIEDTSALINFSDTQLETLKEIVNNGFEQYGKVSATPQEVEKSTKRVIYKIDDFNKPLEETKVAAAEENVGIIASAIDDLKVEKDKNLDIVYLDEEFQGSETDPAEEVEDTNKVEEISEIEDTEKVEVISEVEDTKEPAVEPEPELEEPEPEEPEEVELEPEVEEAEELEPELEEPVVEQDDPEEEPEVDDEAADVEETTEEPEVEDTEEPEEEPELDDEVADVEETTEEPEVEDTEDPEEEPEVDDEVADVEETTEDTEVEEDTETSEEEPEFEKDTEELEVPEVEPDDPETDDPVFVADTEDIEDETEPEVDDETPSVEEDTEEPEVEEDTDDPEVEEDSEDTDDVEELEEDIEPSDDPEVEEDTDDTDDPEPTEEPDPLSEIEQQSSNDSDNKGIILTLASFDGKISIGEVQSLFECSYTKAKDILDEIVKDGKLAWTIDEEIFEFVAK